MLKRKHKPKQNKKTTLNNRLKNTQSKTVIAIISQFTLCRFCFYFLSGILPLKQEYEYTGCTNSKNQA